eukprot:364648-Chlamydomonas_euryale.AAC.9
MPTFTSGFVPSPCPIDATASCSRACNQMLQRWQRQQVCTRSCSIVSPRPAPTRPKVPLPCLPAIGQSILTGLPAPSRFFNRLSFACVALHWESKGEPVKGLQYMYALLGPVPHCRNDGARLRHDCGNSPLLVRLPCGARVLKEDCAVLQALLRAAFKPGVWLSVVCVRAGGKGASVFVGGDIDIPLWGDFSPLQRYRSSSTMCKSMRRPCQDGWMDVWMDGWMC